ncbi:putative LysR family regulatory protein [Xylariaceae sp. FL1651]|nr:putative LysR family regulatory protein [Xylariaceae sp. FL1651]
MGLFTANRAQPPIVPTDDVTPLRFVDELYPVSFDFTLVFRDVMDTEILRASANKVLQREGWRQLGARLRRTKDGRLEYHMPAEFTEERPLFQFTTDRHDMSIDDHPVLCNLPKANGEKPMIFKPSSASFRPYTRSPTTPEDFDDWLYNDIPQLAIHVINFEDATIITVTLLHTLTDFLGLMAFYRAWLATLHDKEDQIAPYIGYKDKDPLENLQQGKQPPKYVFADRVVKGWGLFKFVVRTMWDRFWYPEASLRFFTLPGKFVDKLAASARSELAAAQKDDKAFVSDSDVLCAWWTRLIVKNLNYPPNRSVCLTNRFDSRDILAKMGLLPSLNVSFFGNAAYSASCFAPASSYASASYSLGLLAHQVRDSIQVHRTVEQLQAQDAAFRESMAKTGRLPLYGDSDMLLCIFTNCARGKLFHLDFSPAIIGQDSRQRKSKRGLPVFLSCTGKETRLSSRNVTAILGKTESGDWWMSSRLRHDVWEKIEEEFKKM